MPLLKDGRLVGEDAFQPVADDAALPESGAVLVTYARWQAEKEQLSGRNAPLGILLPNTLDVLDFGPEAERFDLIVLQFPKFSDGRAYSQARLLRARYRFGGEVRATGEVVVDMLPLLARTGFDAVVMRPGYKQESADLALRIVPTHYQGDVTVRQPIFARTAA